MIWILLLICLGSSVFGMFVVKMSPTTYRVEEDDNVTIGWDSQTKADMSLTNLVCFLQSEPPKILYNMVNGVDIPGSQHQQFAGRVHCNNSALRGGRISLHVSRLMTNDSGKYRCDLAANYDQTMRRWVLEATEHFNLYVSPRREICDEFLAPTEVAEAERPKEDVASRDRTEDKASTKVAAGAFLLFASVLVAVAAAQRCFTFFFCGCKGEDKGSPCCFKDRCPLIQYMVTKKNVSEV